MQGLDRTLLAIENLRYKLYPGPGYQIMLRIIYYYFRARAREPSSRIPRRLRVNIFRTTL